MLGAGGGESVRPSGWAAAVLTSALQPLHPDMLRAQRPAPLSCRGSGLPETRNSGARTCSPRGRPCAPGRQQAQQLARLPARKLRPRDGVLLPLPPVTAQTLGARNVMRKAAAHEDASHGAFCTAAPGRPGLEVCAARHPIAAGIWGLLKPHIGEQNHKECQALQKNNVLKRRKMQTLKAVLLIRPKRRRPRGGPPRVPPGARTLGPEHMHPRPRQEQQKRNQRTNLAGAEMFLWQRRRLRAGVMGGNSGPRAQAHPTPPRGALPFC